MLLRNRSNSSDIAKVDVTVSGATTGTATGNVIAGGEPGDLLTVRHLRVEGDNQRIGQVMAEASRAVYGADAGPHRAVDSTVQRARRRWFATHYPTLTERLSGVADVFGVDPSDDQWDLARLGRSEIPAGCSAVFHAGDRTKNRHALLGRNFDFPTGTYSDIVGVPPAPGEAPLAADPWVVELRPDHGYATIVVGIMDMMGGMDGINEVGLAVTLLADNESPTPEPSVVPQVGLSEQQIVRYVLETCRDVEEAKQALLIAKQYYIFVPCHFLVADRSGRSFVWEYSRGHNREHIVESAPSESLVCTNHLLHRWPDPTRLPNDRGSAGTASFTYDRWRALDTQITRRSAPDAGRVRDQLDTVRFTYPTSGVRTLWQAVYDLDKAAIEVSFFAGDRDGASHYTEPIRFQLTSDTQDRRAAATHAWPGLVRESGSTPPSTPVLPAASGGEIT